MVKFSHGCWHPAENTIIDWAVEVVKSEAREDSLHFLFPSEHPKHSKAVFTSKAESNLTLGGGKLRATVNTAAKSFDIDFSADGEKLTNLGWRSVGYVKQNTTALHPKANYTEPGKGKRWVTYQLTLAVGAKVFGLGERFGPFQKNGQTVEMWNDDGGTGSELTYKNIPFFLTSAGYGVFIPSPSLISFEIQTERTTRINIAIPGESLSMYLIHGSTPKDIIQKYTTITGRPALPPPWTFGLWLSTSFTTDYDENTVNKFLDGMAGRDIHTSVFHFDCFWMKGFEWCNFKFDEEMFPDAKGQIARIKERGNKVVDRFVAGSIHTLPKRVRSSTKELRVDTLSNAVMGLSGNTISGSVTVFHRAGRSTNVTQQAGMAFVDFTNPAACKWYQSKLEALVVLGVDSFKTDFGERIPTGDAVYFDGSDPEKMHNFYPYLYNKVTFEVLERAFGNNNAALFARSATAGVQRFPVHWGGDPFSTFEAMAETLRGGLSLGLCGFGYWAHDIGGFEGNPDPGLYKRWIAFGLLSSHSRLHGSGSYRVPWLIDPTEEASTILRKFVDLKHKLIPYLYSTAIASHLTGFPMLRATFLEFPEDRSTWHLDTQYMLGPSLLVAPIFNVEGKVEYYVPKGEWYGILDGKVRKGPGYVVEKHGFESLPLLVRPGSAIVLGKGGRNVVYEWEDGYTL
ncbi:hypothetical protein BDZ45DRAFT_585053 [Acephala macrosclerotiorum]|nr:hypothetical protein BDZ45DRAFT_585053 [Acephala macrosclerotiorum]